MCICECVQECMYVCMYAYTSSQLALTTKGSETCIDIISCSNIYIQYITYIHYIHTLHTVHTHNTLAGETADTGGGRELCRQQSAQDDSVSGGRRAVSLKTTRAQSQEEKQVRGRLLRPCHGILPPGCGGSIVCELV